MNKLSVFTVSKRNELVVLTLSIIFFLTRSSIPFFKYPFLFTYAAICIYILIARQDEILSGIKSLKENFGIVLFLFFYLIIASILSDKTYLIVVKDITNIIILLSIFVMLKLFIHDSNDFKLFYNFFIKFFIIFAFIVSLQRIYSFFYDSSYTDFYNAYYLHVFREIVDRNFALIPTFIGMAGILSILCFKISKSKSLVYNILLFVFSISFIFSGSRRGVFIFILMYLLIIVLQALSIFSNNLKIKHLCKNIRYYFVSFSFGMILLVFMVFNTSVYFKNRVLAVIGVKNISFTKELISDTVFRYIHFLDKELTSGYIYSKIWHPVFDSKDPEAWTGNGNYKIARKLSGRNVEIIPEISKGYLLDSTCLGFASSYHSYYFLPIKEDSVKSGDSLLLSVYCYVSNEFDGNAVGLRADGLLVGDPDKYYDLTKKGCWQKLDLSLGCSLGKFKVYLYMNKGGVKDFSNMKGYVIFAYPEIYKISNINSPSFISELTMRERNLKCSSAETKDLFTSAKNTFETHKSLSYAEFLNFRLSYLMEQIIFTSKTDPIRNWIAKIVSEDTVYHGYNQNLHFKKAEDNFGEDRTTHWKFALEIFNKEFNLKQKIFGGGFNFLNWYGYRFDDDKTKSDYPHNPFLHILLYSGILGLLLYIFFLYRTVYYLIIYFNEYPALSVFFAITYFFTFFSGGSPFDPPIMGFFVILPFFIHSIHKKDVTSNERSVLKNE